MIVLFDTRLLDYANEFYRMMLEDRNFTHFRHTKPDEMLGREKRHVWLTLDGGEISSWGQAQLFPFPEKEHIARLGLAVHPRRTGKGLGSAMLDFMLEIMQNYEKLTATIFGDNQAALSMFLGRGFVIEGIFRDEERLSGQSRDVISLARFQGAR